ncbi:MAG: spermidine synthase [Sphingomonas sp.]
MTPRELIGQAVLADGGTLRLIRRGADHVIMLGPVELMSSRLGGSEEALATLACARLSDPSRARLLIGGLGMGFTLRAALAALPATARIDVAEIVPEVIDWARGPLAGLFAGSLDDPRVTMIAGDVATPIAAAPARYDGILLDVDNGPDGLTLPANDALYGAGGLARAARALAPGGILAIWSSAPDAAFTRRLGQAGFRVEEIVVRGLRGRGGRHVIWLGTRP